MKTTAGTRIAVSAPLGTAAGVVASFFTIWQAATLIGWDVAIAALLGWIWSGIWGLGAAQTKKNASREDPSLHLSELIVLTAGVAVLAAVGLALLRAGSATGGDKAYLITLGVVSVALSWLLVHTVFTLRYARAYYAAPVGGIDFNEDDPPTYLDFAYLAMTIGMTFQVSDTNLTTKRMRHIALSHALLSYLFGAVIVGLVINVVLQPAALTVCLHRPGRRWTELLLLSLGQVELTHPQLTVTTSPGPLDRQLLQPALRADPVHVLDPTPTAIRTELPRVGLVGEHQVQHLEQAGLQLGITDGDQDLDPPVEVAAHQVGGADVDLERQALAHRRDPSARPRSGRSGSARGSCRPRSAPGCSRRARGCRAVGGTAPARPGRWARRRPRRGRAHRSWWRRSGR